MPTIRCELKAVAMLLVREVGGMFLKVPCSKRIQRFAVVAHWFGGLKVFPAVLLILTTFFCRAEIRAQSLS